MRTPVITPIATSGPLMRGNVPSQVASMIGLDPTDPAPARAVQTIPMEAVKKTPGYSRRAVMYAIVIGLAILILNRVSP